MNSDSERDHRQWQQPIVVLPKDENKISFTLDRTALYFTDGRGTVCILGEDEAPLGITNRQKAIARALLELALEQLEEC